MIKMGFAFILLFCCGVYDTMSQQFRSYQNSSAIKVTFIEKFDAKGSFLMVNAESVKQQTCRNCKIITTSYSDKKRIAIEFEGVKCPEICLTALGPARETIPLNLKSGRYNLQFINRNQQNIGSIKVDKDKYVIHLDTPKNIFLSQDTLYRIPKNTYWGYIEIKNIDKEIVFNNLIDTLISCKAHILTMKNGDYGHFRIVNKNIFLAKGGNSNSALPLIFSLKGENEQLLRKKIKSVIDYYSSNVSLQFQSSNGTSIGS